MKEKIKVSEPVDPNDLPSGTSSGFNNPWGHDLNLMPVKSGMSVYDELRYLENRSYNEKVKMWKRKQAAIVAEENRRKKRAEQRDLATLYGTGEVKSKVLRYLKRAKESWSRPSDIRKAIQVPKTSVKGALEKLEKKGLIEVRRKPGYTFVRLLTIQTSPDPPKTAPEALCRQLSTPVQSEPVLTPATVTDTPEPAPEALCRQSSTAVQSEPVPTPVAVTDTPKPVPEILCRQMSTGDRIIEKLKGSGSWVSMEELEAVSGSTNVYKMISALRHRHGYEIVSQTFYRLNKFPHS